jgi:flagellar biosynthesis component FlhA
MRTAPPVPDLIKEIAQRTYIVWTETIGKSRMEFEVYLAHVKKSLVSKKVADKDMRKILHELKDIHEKYKNPAHVRKDDEEG